MENPRDIRIFAYQYELPENRIAKFPLKDRSQSKCLVYDGCQIIDKKFQQMPEMLKEPNLLVLNNTRVIQARLLFPRPLGGRPIEIFCLEPFQESIESAMQAKYSVTYKVLIGGAKRWKENSKISIQYAENHYLHAERLKKDQDVFLVSFTWLQDVTFSELLDVLGHTPIPPYLRRKEENLDKDRYQTVFAEQSGSVAAPTAGLHFTEPLLEELVDQGTEIHKITLHVGAGTFKPVSAETMLDHPMHQEPFIIRRSFIRRMLEANAPPVIAVGTTSVRTLESLFWMGIQLKSDKDNWKHVSQWTPYDTYFDCTTHESLMEIYNFMVDNNLDELTGTTQLIIAPGYCFRVVDKFFTNFHQPGSTLLLLVAAALGNDWRKIYRHAMEAGYRFLSYGDSSLLTVDSKYRKK
jgi:S-adenosylmethionine:tRNA ribosyltransferase-isomerase